MQKRWPLGTSQRGPFSRKRTQRPESPTFLVYFLIYSENKYNSSSSALPSGFFLTGPFSKLTGRPRSPFMANVGYARQADTCPEGTAFYKCAVGPFVGCCSRNPCDTGVCSDVDSCNSGSPPEGQASTAEMTKEHSTTLTVTVSRVIKSLTETITISDVVASLITVPAVPTTLTAAPSPSTKNTHTPNPSTIPSSSTSSRTNSHLSTRSTLTDTLVSPTHGTTATAPPKTSAITDSSKAASSWTTQSSPAPSGRPASDAAHTTTIAGAIAGSLSLMALLALLLLCCCCRRRAKYSFGVKRKSKESKDEQKRAELLRKAEEAALRRQALLGTAITTGAQSPVGGRAADGVLSPYPRNST